MKPLQKNFKNWTIVRGDFVKILTGDDKGKKGKVVKVLRKLNRVVVKNININTITKGIFPITKSLVIVELKSKNQARFMFRMWDFMILLQKKQSESQLPIIQIQVKSLEFPRNQAESSIKPRIKNIKEQKEAKLEK